MHTLLEQDALVGHDDVRSETLLVSQIVACFNPHLHPEGLSQAGYTLFSTNSQSRSSLVQLALSSNVEDYQKFISLIEQYEPNILSQMKNEFEPERTSKRLVLPLLVYSTPEGYCLVGGVKVLLGVLYMHVKAKILGDTVPPEVKVHIIKDKKVELFKYILENHEQKGCLELMEGWYYHHLLRVVDAHTGRIHLKKDVADELGIRPGTLRYREALWIPKQGERGLSDEERLSVAKGDINPSFASKRSLGEFVVGDGVPKPFRSKPLTLHAMRNMFDCTSAANPERRKAIADCMGLTLSQAIQESHERLELLSLRMQDSAA